MANPIENFIDDPNNLFERTKDAVGDAFGGAMETDAGQKALELAAGPLEGIAKLAAPYREGVAPALSAVLLELNGNYRAQNRDLSIAEGLRKGFELAKTPVEGEEEWRRSVSPGRALVGLIGYIDGTGIHGTDKINWDDSKQVNDYFSSGSAQFWSGFADLGFNLADPVAILGGKAAKLVKRSQITREVGSKYGKIENLVQEVDAVVANPQADTAAAQIFKLVEKDPDDIKSIQAYGFVAASADPQRLALTLSNGYKGNGYQGVADVIKASLGHKQTLDRLAIDNASLHEQILTNSGTTQAIRDELNALNKTTRNTKELTPEQIATNEANQKQLLEAIAKGEEEGAALAAKKEVTQVFQEQQMGISSTWSKYTAIERVRAASATISTNGLFPELDGTTKFHSAKAVAKSLGKPTPYVRSVMWISPNQGLKELPAGIAFLGGAPGKRSYLEADARIRNIGRLANLSSDEMKGFANQYRLLTNESERFNFFENFEEFSIQKLLEKHYGETLKGMNATQREAAQVLARELVDSTRRAKSRQLQSILSKNYTITDKGTTQTLAYIDDVVKRLASERAAKEGRDSFNDNDILAVRNSMAQNPATSTQIPNIHFTVDMRFFDQIMSENPQHIKNVLNGILEDGLNAKQVREIMERAEQSAIDGGSGMHSTFGDIVKPMARTGKDVAVDGMDSFYSYVWKPFTLLSFKYTTRNIAEGWLRVVASMVDMNSYYGYGWTDMIRGLKDPGSVSRYANNRSYRKQSKESLKDFREKSKDVGFEQSDLKRQIVPSASGYKAAASVRGMILDAEKKERFKSSDGMALSIDYLKKQIKYVSKHKSSGIPEADDAVKAMNGIIKELSLDTVKLTDSDGKEFIRLLIEGEYNAAHSFANSSNSEKLIASVSEYRDNIDMALAEINKHSAGGASTVEFALENAKFALERLSLHTDKTISLLVKRGELRDELQVIASKTSPGGNLRKSFSGKDQVEIYPGVYIDQSLANAENDLLRDATSSKSSSTRLLADDRRVTGFSIMARGFKRKPVMPTDAFWAQSHADYVNNVMMLDPVMSRLIQGRANGLSDKKILEDVKKWVHSNDTEAIVYRKDVSQNLTSHSKAMGTSYSLDDTVDSNFIQVLQYLPEHSVNQPGKVYPDLAQKAINGLTPEDSAKIMFEDRIEVMAARESHDISFNNIYKNAVASVFKFIGTLPEDHLVRHPFFNMVHDNEARRLANITAQQGRAAGLNEEEVAKYVAENAKQIKVTATDRAYKELMQRLYSVERYTDPGKFMRFVTPFYMAHQNSSRFWLGTSLRNPEIAYMLAKAYNAPFRAGYVYDQNGEIVESGNPWSTDSQKENIELTAPEWIRRLTGKDTWTASPNGLDVIFQGQLPIIPTLGGPGGEIVATEAIKLAAKNTNTDTFLQNNLGMTIDEFSGKYILPFYQKGYGKSVAGNIYSSAIPFNSATTSALAVGVGFGLPLNGIAQQFIPDVKSRWISRYNAARDQVATQMLMDNEPLVDTVVESRARDIARKALMLEAASSFFGPVVAFKGDDAKVRELNARLKKLQDANGYAEGSLILAQQLENEGQTFGKSITSTLQSSSVDNRFGLVSTVATVQGVSDNIDSMSRADMYYKDNPFIGELFNQIGGDKKYSPIADDTLFGITINGTPLKSRNMSPEDAERSAQYNAAWSTYFANVDYIEADAEKNGIKKGSSQYRAYYTPWKNRLADFVGKQFPLWDTRENKITLQKSDAFLAIATHFTSDDKFMSTVGKDNDAINGLIMYLEARDTIAQEFQANQLATGYTTLDSRANVKYADWRDRTAEYIIAQHPGFKQMYNRYLSQDELNPIDSPLLEGSK
jgi:hypothetical protein